MDFAKEEASLVYEERLGVSHSPDPHEDSDEDDGQRELEEMLYSHVYYDDTSINAASPEAASTSPTTVAISNIGTSTVARQLGFASSGIDEPTTSMGSLQLQAGCNRSQFNHPSRFKASRYYDNGSSSNSKSTFVAPSNPGQKYNLKTTIEDQRFTRPSEFTTRLMVRSVKEISYKPKVSVSYKDGVKTIIKDNSSPSRSLNMSVPDLSKDKTAASIDSAGKPTLTQSPPSCSSSSLETSTDSDLSKELTTSDESGQNTHSRKSNEKDSGIQNSETGTCDKEKGEEVSTVVSKETKSPRKRSHDLLSENSPRTRKIKQQSFEAKVSKVLSSMLDEESRSSIDEAPTSLHSNHNLHNLNADSSWSVGMSWADMSSKYSFGVDSIEEESVSSLQLQEGSSNADSRTHTPDLIGRASELDKDEETTEFSRYQIQLKVPEKETSACESDSESEVGSIVEVAPPVKPPPPIVDLSDGEYVPVINTNKKSLPNKKDITVIFPNQKEKRGEFIIESSSDDDLVILDVIDHSKRNDDVQLRGPTKRRSFESSLSEHSTPFKRLAVYPTTDENETSAEGQRLLETGRALLEKPIIPKEKNKMDNLDQWLHNPIRSSKFLDHGKFLKKMSDDPKLWQLCQADIFNSRSSGYGPKCVNCNQFGHKVKFCPAPRKLVVCHMCGVPGHSEPRCPKKMCLRCGEKSNIYTDKCKKCVSLDACKICESKLHNWKSCPDLWRRYHLTTTSGEISKSELVEVRPRSEQWCSNCAGKYHLSHECTKPQWKCDQITPYIRSYLEVNDQEQKIEGQTEVTMLLSKDNANVLSTPEGKEFLDNLATECKIIIHSSLDVQYKKLVLEGTSVNLQEAREKIMTWTKKQKIILADSQKMLKELKQELKPPRDICPKLPSDRDRLITVLEHQLQFIENPSIGINMTVQQLYDSLKSMSFNVREGLKLKNSGDKAKRKKYTRLLNMVLVGRCGMRGGAERVAELKACLKKLKQNVPAVHKGAFLSNVKRHFFAVFGSSFGEHFDDLVKDFYANEDFVKKFDFKQDQNITTDSEVSSSQKTQHANPNENISCVNPNKTVFKIGKGHTDRLARFAGADFSDTNTKSSGQFRTSNLLAVEKSLRHTVPQVIANLSSRFIVSQDRKELSEMFQQFCIHVKRRCGKIDIPDEIKRMKALVDKCRTVCKKYKIKL
ncbi:hypothetical protein FOCC_FOCC006174 [Frankliniella occidentalis]|uniref:Zinc finger CCHC domain-containing protein 7 n=1 Tax=Frankliniella occidentalis TaxID=133901 RepID=A0A6J1SAP3_FRAOC|nr:uncharacterized protein LOC113206399 [Frankliniella occidentalis]KAE8747176.1 hypothetical protein FOCC_FOCC006174 [Frankliniella occidentalis]